ncbi:MAG: NHLP leader peptide family natural product precursor [Firmicutes bacterium]|nr:NHLP leader peptide family natural product precursor [Bacillota bacterium]
MSNQEEKLIISELINRCWKDEAFKKEFIANPKKVLTENGVEVEDGVEYKVADLSDSNAKYITIPKPPKAGELSEEDLDDVSGGWFGLFGDGYAIAVK